MDYSHSHAVQAQHFLRGTEYHSVRDDTFLGGTEYVSKTEYFELAAVNATELLAIRSKTFSDVTKHLCLDVDVDSCWEDLPSATRRAIVCRVTGRPVPLSMQ